jgi:peptide-methionine (S)-S-oxide reductase
MIFNLFSRLSRPFTTASRLSIAPESSAATSIPEGAQRCTVAAGCYWGTEHLYRKHFSGKGLIDAKVGFIGGDLDNPTYRAVCGGRTGRKFANTKPFPFLCKSTPTNHRYCYQSRR